MIRVGDEIADILTKAGISVLHDTQPNDYPNYNGAYERMRQTIEEYLAEYPSIRMVLDVHRDAAEDADGNPVALTAEIDGEACAELMLVVGTDRPPVCAAILIFVQSASISTRRRAPCLLRSVRAAIRWPRRCAPRGFSDRRSPCSSGDRYRQKRLDKIPLQM